MDCLNIYDHRKLLGITDEKERNRQLALWACDIGFKDLKKKPLPTRPDKIKDYYALPFEQRRLMNDKPDNYPKFWNHSVVSQYFESVTFVKATNKSNRYWLETYKGWLDSVLDAKQIDMIDDVLYDHVDNSTKNGNWEE